MAVGGPRRRVPARRRASLRAVARHAARGDDARPVEDRSPGGDRRRGGGDRLLPLQHRVHAADLPGAADLVARRVEPPRVPAARRLRLRRLAVQLHGDRCQPDELAGADGEHRRLEAGRHRDALRVLPDAALPGGGAAGRRDQPRLRQRRDDRRCGARESAPRRHPLHRLDARLQRDVAHRGGQHGPLPQLPAHRRRDRRQGLHRRASFCRRRLARRGDRARLVRVPGPEMLGRLPGLRAVEPVAGAAGAPPGGGGVDQGRRRHRLRQLHGRRDRRRARSRRRSRRSRRRRATPTPRSSSAAATTTRAATSSTRRCSRHATRISV